MKVTKIVRRNKTYHSNKFKLNGVPFSLSNLVKGLIKSDLKSAKRQYHFHKTKGANPSEDL